VDVTDVGGAAGADAIGGGADDIGRDPVVVTIAICSGTTRRPVCGDPRRGSDGGAIGLGEERLGDPRRGGDGAAIGFDWAWGWETRWRFYGGALSEVGYRAQWGLLVGPGRAGAGWEVWARWLGSVHRNRRRVRDTRHWPSSSSVSSLNPFPFLAASLSCTHDFPSIL
jgi:hypothetical protein